jgi:hypothetical protein
MLISFISWADIGNAILTGFYNLAFSLNGLVYNVIDFSYQVFMAIASAKIFNDATFKDMANRIYIIIGVVALFFIAYALLRAIADPDGSSKGEMAPGKIVPNVLKAIILIAFIPTIFSFAYQMQNVILSTNVIGNLLVDDYTSEIASSSGATTFALAGKKLASEIYEAFIELPDGKSKSDIQIADGCKYGNCGNLYGMTNLTYEDISNRVSSDANSGFDLYCNLASNAAEDSNSENKIFYNFLFQLAVGCFLVYVFISFCIDLGLRAIKLGYFQILAPLPILTMIIPNQKKIFDNWLKATLSTFADVFVKVAVMFFGIWMVNHLPSINDLWDTNLMGSPSAAVAAFAKIFIIIGIILFIKQAPQLISDITGIKAGSFKLGIGDKLRDGGVFGVAGAAGAIGLAAANKIGHNYADSWQNAKGKGIKAHAAAIAKGTGKSLNPLDLIRYGNAGVKGYGATKDAKSFGDWSSGMNKGVAQALSAPTMVQNIAGTASDVTRSVKNSVVTDYTPYDSKHELAKAARYDEVKSKMDAINAYVDKSNDVKVVDDYYQGLLQRVQESNDSNVNNPTNIKAIRDEWDNKKRTARNSTIHAKLGKGDIELSKLLESYSSVASQNKDILEESIKENQKSNPALMEEYLAGLKDPNFQANIKNGNIFNDTVDGKQGLGRAIGSNSGHSASAIRYQAMEEEQKKDAK